MTGRLLALAARLERHRGLLGLAKLANVGLGMIWGFVVTFVFVRLLPLAEFRTFLLLVAFANFTISAELGFSTVIYSRMRRSHLSGEGTFRSEELGVLLLFMSGLIALGALAIALGLAGGLIRTGYPALFLAFYVTSALNMLAFLCRRALAALDHNLWWETLDNLRRLFCVAALFAALAGLPILLAVLAQLALSALAILLGLMTVQRELAMPPRHWWSLRAGAAHVRGHYLADIGRTSALTISDIAAYNAPYFTIAAATHDPRPLLLFDFVYKMSRALTALIRAMVETMLPDLTRHFVAGAQARFRARLLQLLGLALGMAVALSALLLLAGPLIADIMFDGKLRVEHIDMLWIVALIAGLAPICVSVYLHNGLGRFAALMAPSFVFLAGSLASVPAALWLGGDFGLRFLACYALVHLAVAAGHGHMLRGLARKGAKP
jgi:O-antigen/teichoic acid export membrane protein